MQQTPLLPYAIPGQTMIPYMMPNPYMTAQPQITFGG
jgi:hypothetical protein